MVVWRNEEQKKNREGGRDMQKIKDERNVPPSTAL